MRILVTGSSGHIGGAVARHLAGTGHEVIGLSRRRVEGLGDIRQVQEDVGDPDFVQHTRDAVERCDMIVHAAACLSTHLHEPMVIRTNCLGTQQALELAAAWETQRFVYISGVAVVGVPVEHPLTESHPTQPRNVYTASKLFGEHLTQVAAQQGLCATVLRLTSPVGPGLQRDRIFSIFVRHAREGAPITVHGQGTRRQNYVDVRDVARAVDAVLEHGCEGVFNIGGAEALSNLELGRLCAQVLGGRSNVRLSGEPDAQDDVNWVVSCEKAGAVLGYVPKYSIVDSIYALSEEIGGGEQAD